MSPRHASLRKGRTPDIGQGFLVTFTTHRRLPLFDDPTLAWPAAAAIVEPLLWTKAALLAWILMPDHWHGIVHARDESISRIVQRLKCNVARRVNLARAGRGPVWAAAFHDRGLRGEAAMLAMARYIVLNPVRAGLVSRPGDYPYWDAVWLQGKSSRLTSLLR